MKFMNMKRFGSIAMAGALALSLTAPAFAESAAPSNTSTKITGAYKEVPIAVSVPTSGEAQINPYGLPVSITKSDGMSSVNIVGQKITSKPLNIKNLGNVKLDVNASLLVIPKGDVAIAASKGASDKTIAVNLEVAGLNDAKYAVSSMEMGLEDSLLEAFVADATWAGAQTLAAPAVAQNATTGTAAKSGAALAVLGASTEDMGMVTYGKDSIALFRLTGDLNAEPTKTVSSQTVDDPWVVADGFEANIVFKFTPHQDAPSAGDATLTMAPTTASLDSSTTTTASLTATFAAGTSGLTVTSYAWSSSDATAATVGTGTTNSETVTYAGAGSTTVTCTATLSNGATLTATCAVTCS